MLAERLLKWTVLLALGGGVALSCSVDHRKLHGSSYAGYWIIAGGADGEPAVGGNSPSYAGNAGGGERFDAGGAPVGTGADAGDAGDDQRPASGGSTTTPIIDGCADLDSNGEGDCNETLVKNPDFPRNTADWTADDGASIEWSPQNRFDDQPSGSMSVSLIGATDAEGIVLKAATQCVDVATNGKLQVLANVLTPSGQGDGGASISVFFFPNADCGGAPAGTPMEVPTSSVDAWQTLRAEQAVPQGTGSALVRLAVAKAYRTPVFRSWFDNILIRVKR